MKASDWDDKKKRWLVIGICLHTVLSPALKKYVVPVLKEIYNELTSYHKIDLQTYSTHLNRYPTTNAFLNYEAANNNKAKHGYQITKYDYTIRNIVELSKLFLKTSMAHYTSFDETCDSSTWLELIINIDKFPPVVKVEAENVCTISV